MTKTSRGENHVAGVMMAAILAGAVAGIALGYIVTVSVF
jgi:hypothetical protein|tara:strand:- start:489 stop:605 length:117 start_codon:yes stop_codon:yes gene_type:complete